MVVQDVRITTVWVCKTCGMERVWAKGNLEWGKAPGSEVTAYCSTCQGVKPFKTKEKAVLVGRR